VLERLFPLFLLAFKDCIKRSLKTKSCIFALCYNALYLAYNKISYREQRTLAKHLGFCDSCWSAKKATLKNGEVEYIRINPMTFEEIPHSASQKTDKALERTFYTALEKMKKYIEEYTDYRYIFG
jgi:hypothetical protein